MPTDQEIDHAFELIEQRAQFTKGLRELADFLDAHPSIPVASYGSVYGASHDVFGLNKTDLVFAARTPNTGPWDKSAIGSFFELSKTFSGGVKLVLNGDRKEVCEQVVVGYEEVTVPARPATEAEPEHVETRAITEWKCLPLLGE